MNNNDLKLKKLVSLQDCKRLTDRDIEIIRFVRDNVIVSRSQIQMLFFPSKQGTVICNRRLAVMEKLEFIRRMPMTLNGESLVVAGRMLQEAGGVYLTRLPSDYTHQLLVNEVYVLLLREQLKNSFSILQYKPEFVYKFRDNQENKLYVIRSDIFTVIERNKKKIPLLFEIDAGTESKKQLREKLLAYEKISNKVKGFPNLYWVANDKGYRKLLTLGHELIIAQPHEIRENFFIWTKLPEMKKVKLLPDTITWNI